MVYLDKNDMFINFDKITMVYLDKACQTVYINPFWYHSPIQLLPDILLLAVICSNSENSFCLSHVIATFEGIKSPKKLQDEEQYQWNQHNLTCNG
jgi:hypothetical protein